jgi:hypothetical protein
MRADRCVALLKSAELKSAALAIKLVEYVCADCVTVQAMIYPLMTTRVIDVVAL